MHLEVIMGTEAAGTRYWSRMNRLCPRDRTSAQYCFWQFHVTQHPPAIVITNINLVKLFTVRTKICIICVYLRKNNTKLKHK